MPRGGDPRAAIGRAIECSRLVRVLAVAQRLDQPSAKAAKIRRFGLELGREPIRDRGVIGGCARIGFGGETPAQVLRRRTGMGREFLKHGMIVLRLYHDRDIVMVLGRGPNHRRTTDVDIFDALLEARAFADRRLERIEIDHQQVNRRDAVGFHRGGVIGIVADREQRAMHVRVQGLHPSIHHLGKPRQFRDVANLEPGGGEGLCSATG